MGNQAKRHHTVSRFYLRHFADGADQVTTVMLPGAPVFTQSITDATVRNRFYTAIDHSGETTDAAEKAFSQIETPASEAWQEVLSGAWPLTASLREAVAGWIALQLLRGHKVRTSMSQLGTEMLQMQVIVGGRRQLKEALRELGYEHDDESVNREWVSLFEDPLQIEVQANHHLQHIADMLPRVAESLLERWWLLTVFDHKGLATSDHPVYVLPNQRLAAMGLGTGIENADEIYVPLTRRHALSMALRSTLPSELASAADRRQPGVAATALYSNSCAVNSARRMLFHHPADTPLVGLELPAPRTKEYALSGDAWSFMADEDRQVLIDAGIEPSMTPDADQPS